MTKVYYTNYKDEKKQSQAGKALLDFVLRKYYDSEGYELRREEGGKPYIEGHPVHFNLSHSGGIVVLAVSDKAVGVDTEPMRQIRAQVIKRYFGEDIADPEDRLFAWLERESYGKMTGEGFAVSEPRSPHVFHRFEVTVDGKKHYICVCTPPDTESLLKPCFVPLP